MLLVFDKLHLLRCLEPCKSRQLDPTSAEIAEPVPEPHTSAVRSCDPAVYACVVRRGVDQLEKQAEHSRVDHPTLQLCSCTKACCMCLSERQVAGAYHGRPRRLVLWRQAPSNSDHNTCSANANVRELVPLIYTKSRMCSAAVASVSFQTTCSPLAWRRSAAYACSKASPGST